MLTQALKYQDFNTKTRFVSMYNKKPPTQVNGLVVSGIKPSFTRVKIPDTNDDVCHKLCNKVIESCTIVESIELAIDLT